MYPIAKYLIDTVFKEWRDSILGIFFGPRLFFLEGKNDHETRIFQFYHQILLDICYS